MVVVQSQSQLFEIVLALSAASRFASLLNGRQEQGNKNGDDRNDDQEFNECESVFFSLCDLKLRPQKSNFLKTKHHLWGG